MTRSSDRRIWARMTVDFADSPKVVVLSDAAFRALVEMILWCRRGETDGVIPRAYADRRWGYDSYTTRTTNPDTSRSTDPITELRTNHPDRPSLEVNEAGDYVLRDFLEHQDSKEQSDARRARNSANVRRRWEQRDTSRTTTRTTNPDTSRSTSGYTEKEKEKEEVLRTSKLSPTTSERGCAHDDEDTPEPTPIAEHRPDVDAVCDAMAASVQRRTGRAPRVTAAWRTQARLMLDRDGRSVEEITRVIDWAEGNDFWRANVLSVPKLRQKFDTLRLQAQRPQRGQPQGGQVFYDLAEQFAKEGL
nr:MAG TPA: replisome organizer protein [Caudoviricetes sp.]